MNILSGRDIDEVIVLGSGLSILELTPEEIAYINRCKVVIAINKFMAFYEKSNILPTHVYFHDNFSKGSLNMFKLILQRCIQNDLENLTFITNPYFKLIAKKKPLSNFYSLILDVLIHRTKPFIKYLMGFKNSDRQTLRLFRELKVIQYPKNSKIVKVRVHNTVWAKSLKDKLFHFKGSLSSVLNYVSICYPNRTIYLVGNDFVGSRYFYEEELEEVDFDWKDHTFQETKQQNKHYSFQIDGGQDISTKMPFIIKELRETGNKVYSTNKESLLVTQADIEYSKLLD